MVAVGNLKKIWLEIPLDVTEEEFGMEFREFFGGEWLDILDAVDISFEYNAYNTAYFSVENIKPVEDINIDQLLKRNGLCQPPNVVVS